MSKMTMTQRKWMLSLHIIFSSIMLGTSVVFLILSITAATAADPLVAKACFTSMGVLGRTSMRASTIGTIVTGVVLSVKTHWGLLKYYWIIAKEALTVACILLGPLGMYIWTVQEDLQHLFIAVILQIVSLVALFLLSVFKPWGQRKGKTKGA